MSPKPPELVFWRANGDRATSFESVATIRRRVMHARGEVQGSDILAIASMGDQRPVGLVNGHLEHHDSPGFEIAAAIAFERNREDSLIRVSSANDEATNALSDLDQKLAEHATAISTYNRAEAAFVSRALRNPLLRLEVESLLGEKPVNPKDAKVWDAAARVVAVQSGHFESDSRRFSNGRRLLAARLIQRAKAGGGLFIERTSRPPFRDLYEDVETAKQAFWDASDSRESPEIVAFLDQKRLLAVSRLADARASAELYAVTHEPSAVITLLGRPQETAEDFALWAPAAAACIEAIDVVGLAVVRNALQLRHNAIDRGNCYDMAQKVTEWNWWAVPAAKIADFSTPSDATTTHRQGELRVLPLQGFGNVL